MNMHSCVRSWADQRLQAVLSLPHFRDEESSCLSFLAVRCLCDTLPRLSRWLSQSSALSYATLVLWVPWFFTVIFHLALCNRFIPLAWIHSMIASNPALQETLSRNTQGSHTLLNLKAWETLMQKPRVTYCIRNDSKEIYLGNIKTG